MKQNPEARPAKKNQYKKIKKNDEQGLEHANLVRRGIQLDSIVIPSIVQHHNSRVIPGQKKEDIKLCLDKKDNKKSGM